MSIPFEPLDRNLKESKLFQHTTPNSSKDDMIDTHGESPDLWRRTVGHCVRPIDWLIPRLGNQVKRWQAHLEAMWTFQLEFLSISTRKEWTSWRARTSFGSRKSQACPWLPTTLFGRPFYRSRGVSRQPIPGICWERHIIFKIHIQW
jgi:hypothetical protein